MPIPAINWGELKAAAIALQSVNEAARRASAQLPPIEAERFRNRVNKRAYRERWLDQATALALSAPSNAKALSHPVQTGSDMLASALADDSQATRMGFSKAARKVAQHTAELPSADLMDKDTSQAAKHWHGIAAGVHGWEQKQDQTAVMVNVALLMG